MIIKHKSDIKNVENEEIKAFPKGSGWLLTALLIVAFFGYGHYKQEYKPAEVNILDAYNILEVYTLNEVCYNSGYSARTDASDLSKIVKRIKFVDFTDGGMLTFNNDFLQKRIYDKQFLIEKAIVDGEVQGEELLGACQQASQQATNIRVNFK